MRISKQVSHSSDNCFVNKKPTKIFLATLKKIKIENKGYCSISNETR